MKRWADRDPIEAFWEQADLSCPTGWCTAAGEASMQSRVSRGKALTCRLCCLYVGLPGSFACWGCQPARIEVQVS